MDQPGLDHLDQGAVLAEYRRRLSWQIFIIVIFTALFLIALDALFFHMFLVPDSFVFTLACVVDLVFCALVVPFTVWQMVWGKPPIAATDRGLLVAYSFWGQKRLFIPWGQIIGSRIGIILIQHFYKDKYLILAVDPGFALPKITGKMFALAPNEIAVGLNHLTLPPDQIAAEIMGFREQFNR